MSSINEVKAIKYVKGDATCPAGPGNKIIVHIVNNINVWGAGFVIALSHRWERPEKEYHIWMKRARGQKMLGAVQLVPVEPDIAVANLVGQHGVGRDSQGNPPIRYKALARGFDLLAQHILEHPEKPMSIHAPRLGCGLAGGKWEKVEPLLNHYFIAQNIPVTIYDL